MEEDLKKFKMEDNRKNSKWKTTSEIQNERQHQKFKMKDSASEIYKEKLQP